ncbi:polyketide synthase dehydratase domain-containing protein [Achromobacter xylosoxidans]
MPAQAARQDSVELPPPDGDPIDVTALYQDLHELGYGYGPTFQGINAAWHVDGDVCAGGAAGSGRVVGHPLRAASRAAGLVDAFAAADPAPESAGGR